MLQQNVIHNQSHSPEKIIALMHPDSRSATLAIVQPTDAEIIAQRQKSSVAWRGALSTEAYLRREEYLRQRGLAKDAGITYWVLVDTALAEKDRVVLAGCETLRKRALVSKNGKVHDAVAHGVASVFCPVENRNRGYAARMIQELGIKLRTWKGGPSGCLFSVLYSDIGKKFYAAHGWHPCPSSHIHMPPTASNSHCALPPNSHLTTTMTQPLQTKDLAHLCHLDEAVLRQRLASHLNPTTAVALIPDLSTIEWHHSWDDFVANELHDKTPSTKGAIVHTTAGHRIWCIWTRMWHNEDPQQSKGNTLYILRLAYDGPGPDPDNAAASAEHIDAVAALLRAAQLEAAEWHMEKVELWNPEWSSVLAAQRLEPEAKVLHRDHESITSLKWYGDADDEIEWVSNEKYGWC